MATLIAEDMRDDYERALSFRNETIGNLQNELRKMQARIAELQAAHDALKDENKRFTELLRGDRMRVATRINHEYTNAKETIRKLEAQLQAAQQWEPLQYAAVKSESDSHLLIIEDTHVIGIEGDNKSLAMRLPDDYAICRKVKPAK